MGKRKWIRIVACSRIAYKCVQKLGRHTERYKVVKNKCHQPPKTSSVKFHLHWEIVYINQKHPLLYSDAWLTYLVNIIGILCILSCKKSNCDPDAAGKYFLLRTRQGEPNPSFPRFWRTNTLSTTLFSGAYILKFISDSELLLS